MAEQPAHELPTSERQAAERSAHEAPPSERHAAEQPAHEAPASRQHAAAQPTYGAPAGGRRAGEQLGDGGRRAARGRPRAFDRDAALEIALREFWSHGYEPTAVSTLAKAIGIGIPSLYAAFGDKRTLFQEVVDVYARTHGAFADRALAAESSARAGVTRMLREAAREYTAGDHPPGCLVISAATNCGPDSADIEDLLRTRRNANITAIESRIQADIDAGILPSDTKAGALARLTGVTIQGMSQSAQDGATRADLEEVANLAMNAWPPTCKLG